MADNFYVLPEHVELHKREDYCVLVDKNRCHIKLLHPSQALILSLLDGHLNQSGLAYLTAQTYQLSQRKARSLVNSVLKESKPYLSLSKERTRRVRRYAPESFIFRGFEEQPGQAQPLRAPLEIGLVLTRRCNFNCLYCYFGSGPQPAKDLEKNLAWRLIQDMGEMGVVIIALAGGEPLLYPHIFELIYEITKRGMLCSFSTNGSLLDEETVDRLVDAGLKRIQVSLDSPTAETHHFLTQTNNTFDSILSGIRRLKSHGMWVRTRSVITPHNDRLIGDLIDLLVDTGVDEVHIGPERAGSCESEGDSSLPGLRSTEMPHVRHIVREKICQHSNHSIFFTYGDKAWHQPSDIVRCGNLNTSCIIHPTGTVSVCEMIRDVPELSYGNVNTTPLHEIWLGPAHRRLLEHVTDPAVIDQECAACEFVQYCHTGCFNLSQVCQNDFFAKDPRCPGAEKIKGARAVPPKTPLGFSGSP